MQQKLIRDFWDKSLVSAPICWVSKRIRAQIQNFLLHLQGFYLFNCKIVSGIGNCSLIKQFVIFWWIVEQMLTNQLEIRYTTHTCICEIAKRELNCTQYLWHHQNSLHFCLSTEHESREEWEFWGQRHRQTNGMFPSRRRTRSILSLGWQLSGRIRIRIAPRDNRTTPTEISKIIWGGIFGGKFWFFLIFT